MANLKNETLCWTCSKATGGCSWSREETPIKNWVAEEVKHEDFISYNVKKCPYYSLDKTELSFLQLAKLIKCSIRTIYRLPYNEINERFKKLHPTSNYELKTLSNGTFVLKRKGATK